MPLFEYKCVSCGLMEEHLIMPGKPTPATFTCSRCSAVSEKRDYPSRIALARSGMGNAPMDNVIGKDAENRWEDIQHRNDIRNKIRSEAGEQGLCMVGRNEFAPITSTQKELRTSLNEAVEKEGFKSTDIIPSR